MLEEKRIAENAEIVVLVKRGGLYSWFVSERDYWIMDYKKYVHSYDANDFDYSERFDIPLLDEGTAHLFFEKMSVYKVDKPELQTLIKESLASLSWDQYSHLFPTLFLDFDTRQLWSLYNELFRFEKFVPGHWEGKYENFYDLVPNEQKYWVIDDKDVLSEMM